MTFDIAAIDLGCTMSYDKSPFLPNQFAYSVSIILQARLLPNPIDLNPALQCFSLSKLSRYRLDVDPRVKWGCSDVDIRSRGARKLVNNFTVHPSALVENWGLRVDKDNQRMCLSDRKTEEKGGGGKRVFWDELKSSIRRSPRHPQAWHKTKRNGLEEAMCDSV